MIQTHAGSDVNCGIQTLVLTPIHIWVSDISPVCPFTENMPFFQSVMKTAILMLLPTILSSVPGAPEIGESQMQIPIDLHAADSEIA